MWICYALFCSCQGPVCICDDVTLLYMFLMLSMNCCDRLLIWWRHLKARRDLMKSCVTFTVKDNNMLCCIVKDKHTFRREKCFWISTVINGWIINSSQTHEYADICFHLLGWKFAFENIVCYAPGGHVYSTLCALCSEDRWPRKHQQNERHDAFMHNFAHPPLLWGWLRSWLHALNHDLMTCRQHPLKNNSMRV